MAIRFDIGTDPVRGPVFAGTVLQVTFTLNDATMDTAGWTTRVTFKQQPSDNAAIVTYTPNQTQTKPGTWTFTMTKADTLLFSVPGTYQYDFERIDNGSEAVLTYGQFLIARKVG